LNTIAFNSTTVLSQSSKFLALHFLQMHHIKQKGTIL
jgi:hypothetical protein